MLTVYIIAAIAGGGLILLSLLGAGHGHDGDVHAEGDFDTHVEADADVHVEADADVHVEADADVHADADSHFDSHAGHGHDAGGHVGPWIPFFSLRFWTYFIGVFGIVGLLLSFLTPIGEPATAALSGGTGFLCGLAVSALMFLLRRSEADSTAREHDLLGKMARVTVAIRDQQVGRVRCEVKGEILDILARSEEPLALEAGQEVVIVGVENGMASVVPREAIFE